MAAVIVKKSDYDYSTLRPIVFDLMEHFCKDRIHKGDLVIIKPNLLLAATPDKAIVTHPMIIKAVAEYVLSRGVRPRISDSPAIGSFEKILRESGIQEALKGLDVECREFKSSVKVDIGEPFGVIDIAEDAVKADVLINLPKLKTHTQMFLTLGVKNLFGCVIGMKKPEWHMRAGVDRKMFAKLLLKIYQALNPAVTIIDGILAMEGQGPGRSGKPRKLGVLIGSADAIALDSFVCRMLCIEENQLLTNMLAKDMGLASDNIEVEGRMPEIRDFRLPGITPLLFGPRSLHGLMRRHLVQRPVCSHDMCTLCGECIKFCPAKAIARKNIKLDFDYEKCIRCYCCVEVCPQGALRSEETIAGKILRRKLKMS